MKSLGKIYEDDYKKLMLIPVIMILFFGGVVFYNKAVAGEFFSKDISLKGGTSITIYSEQSFDIDSLSGWAKNSLSSDAKVVRLIDPLTQKVIGYDFRTSAQINKSEVVSLLSGRLGFPLNQSNFGMGVQSASVADSFFESSVTIIMISLLMMGVISFYVFRRIISSISIMLSTAVDLIVVIGFMNILGIELSVASIAGLLMLIAYSTDSDILLSTNMIKRKETAFSNRIKHALKTVMTMNCTTLIVFLLLFLLSTIDVLKQISIIMIIGIIADFISTWFLMAGLQRIYFKRRGEVL